MTSEVGDGSAAPTANAIGMITIIARNWRGMANLTTKAGSNNLRGLKVSIGRGNDSGGQFHFSSTNAVNFTV